MGPKAFEKIPHIIGSTEFGGKEIEDGSFIMQYKMFPPAVVELKSRITGKEFESLSDEKKKEHIATFLFKACLMNALSCFLSANSSIRTLIHETFEFHELINSVGHETLKELESEFIPSKETDKEIH